MADDKILAFPSKGDPGQIGSGGLSSGSGGGTFDGMEARVKRLEDDMSEIRKDLKTLLIDSAEMKGMLKGMPSAQSFGELKGRVDSLPTTAKVATLLGILGVLVTIATKWVELKTMFG